MINTSKKKFLMVGAVLSIILFLVFGFAACSQSYSADSIKNNLTNAGYTVSEGEKIVFSDDTDTTTLAGLQKIYLVTKGAGEDAEYGFILVFDSIGNADKLSDAHMIEIAESAKRNCGDNKKEDVAMGRHNNVVMGCYSAIKKASGVI